MASSKLSVLGMAKHMQMIGEDLFSGLILPDGIDKEIVENQILLKSADFECLYPDASFLQEAISLWAKTHYRTFEKWIKALNVDYNPLENYDRIEEWKTIDDGSSSFHNDGSNTSDGFNNSQDNVSAFDSSSMQPDKSAHSDYFDHNVNDLGGWNKNDNVNIRTGRAHGNIGVTTSQQMLESELDIAKWNIYEHISDLFLQDFCILIY